MIELPDARIPQHYRARHVFLVFRFFEGILVDIVALKGGCVELLCRMVLYDGSRGSVRDMSIVYLSIYDYNSYDERRIHRSVERWRMEKVMW